MLVHTCRQVSGQTGRTTRETADIALRSSSANLFPTRRECHASPCHRLRFEPARADELLTLTQHTATTLRQQPGFQGFYDGLDRASGTGVAVSLWDTAEHARLSSAAFGDIVPRLQALGVQMEPLGRLRGRRPRLNQSKVKGSSLRAVYQRLAR